MAGSVPSTTNIRGINNTTSSNQVNQASPSRLLLSTNGIRNDLESRNLYTPNRLYPITEKNQLQNILDAVNGVINIIAPFKGYDLNDTVYGRLITQQTPLTTIGLAMLGNQMALNAASHIAQQNFPTIKLANLFDGSKNTHLFTPNINFNITKKPAITNFQQFLDAVVFYNPDTDNPFKGSKTTNLNTIPIDGNPTVQNSYYIQQTNTGQITFLINALNQNIYKQGFSNTATDNALQTAASNALVKFYGRSNLIGSFDNPLNKYERYFNFFNTNPYSDIHINGVNPFGTVNGGAVLDMNTPADNTNPTQEYAPTKDFVDLNFGQSDTNETGSDFQLNEDENTWVGESTEFPDNLDNKIVWGRDNTNSNAWNADTRGSFAGADKSDTTNSTLHGKFNVYTGILEYTNNLLIASQGAIVDQTRKAFRNYKNNVVGFNGSALWVANYSTYASGSSTAGQSGVRQHSSIDQYDRFAKTINFGRCEHDRLRQGCQDRP